MRVLLVEDNPADVVLLGEIFAQYGEAAALYSVRDGVKALDYVRRQHEYKDSVGPDVILLDLGLPRISGYDLLQELKNDPHSSGIPVIVLTASCSPLDREQCRKFGADMFLSKPEDLKGYEELVRMLMNIEFPRMASIARRKTS